MARPSRFETMTADTAFMRRLCDHTYSAKALATETGLSQATVYGWRKRVGIAPDEQPSPVRGLAAHFLPPDEHASGAVPPQRTNGHDDFKARVKLRLAQIEVAERLLHEEIEALREMLDEGA